MSKGSLIPGMPDQGRNSQDVNNGNGKSDQDTKIFNTRLTKGRHDNGHTNIRVKPVAGLGKCACLKTCDMKQSNGKKT